MSDVARRNVVNSLKLYIFPSLVTILAMMIWRDVNELRSDVKQLLAESASNKTKVERLEKQVDMLNQAVFRMPKVVASSLMYEDLYPNEKLFAKHEDFYDVKKYIIKRS